MPDQDWANPWHDPHLGLRALEANFVRHAYPRHSHDYYVICIIDRGRQSFLHGGQKHFTPPGGLILINPGEAHTGEPAAAEGFTMRCLYPTPEQMRAAAGDADGQLPWFTQVRADDPAAHASVAALHAALTRGASPLEGEVRLTWTLAGLVERYGQAQPSPPQVREREAVRQVRRYLDEHAAESVRLSDLAAHVALSPYHLLRAFRAEVGLPPHAYLDSVRIRRAERLIAAGQPLAEVAAETGFSSQSHLTRMFKRVLGVTPGQYARVRAS
jgi:AraC-like DNA-binding protein